MSDGASKALFNISDIKTKNHVLGALLLVMSALLGSWFVLADDGTERIVAGVLMFANIVAFLIAFVFVNRLESIHDKPKGLEDVAMEQASESEVNNPGPDILVAPDRTYVINKPTSDLDVKELSYYEWILGNLGIDKDTQLKESIIKNAPQTALVTNYPDDKNILVFQSKNERSIIPIPGVTKINGRKIPSALEIEFPSRLVILPMDRAQPPFYVERPMIQNFTSIVGQMSNTGLLMLNRVYSNKRDDQTTFYTAELNQKIENAVVDGKENQSVNLKIIVIGIEGEVRDYLLMIYYIDFIKARQTTSVPELEILQSLANSFRPLAASNPDEIEEEHVRIAEESITRVIKLQGKNIFDAEFGIALARINSLDMNKIEDRIKAIRMLKPFEAMLTLTGAAYENMDSFWTALKAAEAGDGIEFKTVLADFLKEFNEGIAAINNQPKASDGEQDQLPQKAG